MEITLIDAYVKLKVTTGNGILFKSGLNLAVVLTLLLMGKTFPVWITCKLVFRTLLLLLRVILLLLLRVIEEDFQQQVLLVMETLQLIA